MKFRNKNISLKITFESLFWLSIITAFIRIFPLRTLLNLLSSPAVKNGASMDVIINSANIPLSMQSRLSQPRCWKKSMLYFRMLKKYGYAPKLHFGVTLEDQDADDRTLLSGHSWVTVCGEPITQEDRELSARYTGILTVS